MNKNLFLNETHALQIGFASFGVLMIGIASLIFNPSGIVMLSPKASIAILVFTVLPIFSMVRAMSCTYVGDNDKVSLKKAKLNQNVMWLIIIVSIVVIHDILLISYFDL